MWKIFRLALAGILAFIHFLYMIKDDYFKGVHDSGPFYIIMETDYFFTVRREATLTAYGDDKTVTNSQCLKIYPDDSSNSPSNNKKTTSSGSGFLLSQTGLVATNYHVIDDSKEIKVFSPFRINHFMLM